MELRKVRVEYRKSPIGLDVEKPRFSWILESDEQNCMQGAYQVRVVELDVAGNKKVIAWDTGKVKSDQSVLVEYEGDVLKPDTTYRVEIHVWDSRGKEADANTTFEIGLLHPKRMRAQWITSGFTEEEKACPVFVREAAVKKAVVKARIYATALGLYEITVNGQRVGDAYFSPGWTSYHHRLQYQAYNVTEMLSENNRIEITVADGWYKGPFGFFAKPNNYGDKSAVLAELHLTYEDGTTEMIPTDGRWKVTTGVIRESQIYAGETIDSNYESTESRPVQILEYGKENLVGQEGDKVCITQRTRAKELIVTPRNELVLDFGQNMSGFVEIHIKGKKGQEVVIHHAEVLDKDGNFYILNLRNAAAIDTYICNGAEQILLPHFTFHGFRYIKIEGMDKDEIQLENFIACTLHSDMKSTGTFTCSNAWINQLQSNIRWAMRSNFLDIPSDCPQRDERLGWTGDAQVFAATASYNMNTALFYKKWLKDVKAEQTKEYGVPHVVPNILGNKSGAAAWSDVAAILPWVVYQTFGDKRVLEEQFDSMKGWVDYITEHCEENGLWQSGYQYGDWLALDKEEGEIYTGATDVYLVANAYYAYSCELVAKAAAVLEKTEEEEKYKALYKKIVEQFNINYITRAGRMVSETQTGCVLALHFYLAEEQYRPQIMKSLKENIERHKNHLTTGFVGTPYICHVLSENGAHDLAGTLFLQEDYPSWLYAVKKGATTIWERWNSIMPDGNFNESGMNSLNHYAYGSIGEWLYRKIAGINIVSPGYKKFCIKPMFIKGITHVEATYESIYGTIKSAWRCENKMITVDVTVPVNTTADIYLPEKEGVITVGSGTYHYEYETNIGLERERFSLHSTLQQLLEEPLAKELLNQYAPGMLDNPGIKMAYHMTLLEMVETAPEGKPLWEMIVKALNSQQI